MIIVILLCVLIVVGILNLFAEKNNGEKILNQQKEIEELETVINSLTEKRSNLENQVSNLQNDADALQNFLDKNQVKKTVKKLEMQTDFIIK